MIHHVTAKQLEPQATSHTRNATPNHIEGQ